MSEQSAWSRPKTSYELARGHDITIQDRTSLSTEQIVEDIWTHLDLPQEALEAVKLTGGGHTLKSSFRIADLAQASIALSALAAALVDSTHNDTQVPKVTVDRVPAAIEFASERVYSIDNVPAASAWGTIGGLHETADGYVRMHDSFPNHARAATDLLGLPQDASRDRVAEKIKLWNSAELEEAAIKAKAVIYALRTYDVGEVMEWDVSPQGKAVPQYPVTVHRLCHAGSRELPEHIPYSADRCLRGLRVLELSRVIAAPVAGRTLAAHGADVLWVTSPKLPSLPPIDKDVQRGKRTVHLHLESSAYQDFLRLQHLIGEADVIIQAYRPGSLAAKGLTPQHIARLRPGIVVANLSAWGSEGPWKNNRGFDSIVQTVSGMNHSEWEHYGEGWPPAKPLPVQALDHAAGYFLATGISAALYKRSKEGGSWEVNVSLAGVMKYLRSLGQLPRRQGFDAFFTNGPNGWAKQLQENGVHGICPLVLDEAMTGFGMMRAVKHSAKVDGKMPGYDVMPKPPGTDKAEWL